MENQFNAVLLISLLWLYSFGLYAQDKANEINEKERNEVVQSISKLLKANYVYPEVADKMAALLESNLKNGKYQSIIQPEEFAGRLTQDLRSVSNDKHLVVTFFTQGPRQQKNGGNSSDGSQFFQSFNERMRRDNFGFKEVKILDGNIGYLDLRGFTDTLFAAKTAVAAMNFLSNTDAIIIDLRNNGGGFPSMIQLITSYFYSAEPVHLNSFYWRPSDQTTETWTLRYVPGKRRPDIDLYVLTSRSTFSAAEEFSYNLKNLRRATLIGETTGGGAHPGGPLIATEHFMISIPSGRAINPISKTDWEGTGVEPDVKTTKEDALNTARILALERLKNQTKEEKIKQYYDWHITSLNLAKKDFTIDSQKLQEYVGKYGFRSVTFEDGKLYGWDSGNKFELIPLDYDLFAVKEMPDFRVQFTRQNNAVTALRILFIFGNNEEFFQKK